MSHPEIEAVLRGESRWCVVQGDCLDVMRSLPDNCVDAVVTDPPYSSGGAFRSDRSQLTTTKYVNSDSIVGKSRPEFSGDNMDQRSFLAFSQMWLSQASRFCVSGAPLCACIDWRQLPTLTDAVQAGGWIWRGVATWWKPGIRMQKGRFSASSEFVVYASLGVPTFGKRSPQNVFSFAPVGGEEKEHIAEKPIEVMKWMMGVVPPNSLIIDPFCGSGSTGAAAIQEGHRFIGIEREPQYCAIARRRIADAAAQGSLF